MQCLYIIGLLILSLLVNTSTASHTRTHAVDLTGISIDNADTLRCHYVQPQHRYIHSINAPIIHHDLVLPVVTVYRPVIVRTQSRCCSFRVVIGSLLTTTFGTSIGVLVWQLIVMNA